MKGTIVPDFDNFKLLIELKPLQSDEYLLLDVEGNVINMGSLLR